jgi:hypothetical protein
MSGRSRQQSGSWGRLKPVNIDPLESIGLLSKGDNRHGLYTAVKRPC